MLSLPFSFSGIHAELDFWRQVVRHALLLQLQHHPTIKLYHLLSEADSCTNPPNMHAILAFFTLCQFLLSGIYNVDAYVVQQPFTHRGSIVGATSLGNDDRVTINSSVSTENPASVARSASSRKDFIRQMVVASAAYLFVQNAPADAAPPFAIIAEEVGYFPVTDERTGETVMVPAKAKRQSTDQAIELAKYLQSSGARMYGAFWCPHCSRQKELFGREAWKYIDYVECSPKGYRSKFATCIDQKVDGYPTWKFGNGKEQGGEMELADIAKVSGYLAKKSRSFDPSLEFGVPPLGGGSCQ